MSNIDIPEEARQKYIERRKTDLENCKKALQQKDFDAIARVGHQVKGNASTFGYEELGSIAIEMEKSALSKDAGKLDSVLTKFSKFLSKA